MTPALPTAAAARARRHSPLITIFYLLTLKPRLLLPVLWKSVKWLWSVKPLTFGLIGLIGFGVYEGYKNTLGRISSGVRNAGLHDAYEARADQMASYEVERFYELYLDGLHSVPHWIAFLANGKQSELHPLVDATPAKRGWIRLGPEPGPPPLFAAIHVNSAHILADLTAWNFLWTTWHPSHFLLPWSWHEGIGGKAPRPERVVTWRLRFLMASEAIGGYVGGLNANPPRRTEYIRHLISTGQLHLSAAEQAKAEALPSNIRHVRTPRAIPAPPARRRTGKPLSSDAPAVGTTRSVAKPDAITLEAPVYVDRNSYLDFFEVTPQQIDTAKRGEAINVGLTLTQQLTPLTELRRLLWPGKTPLAANTNLDQGWLVQLADGRIGVVTFRHFASTHAAKPGIRETLHPYDIGPTLIVPQGLVVDVYLLTNDEMDRAVNHLFVNWQDKAPRTLPPGTRLHQMFIADTRDQISVAKRGIGIGWLVIVNELPAIISPQDFEAVRRKSGQ